MLFITLDYVTLLYLLSLLLLVIFPCISTVKRVYLSQSVINMLFSFLRVSLPFSFFLLVSIHILIYVAETARGRIPSTNYNSRQVFCKTRVTFSFNTAFCPFRLLRNSSYKVWLCSERLAIRAADTFICSTMNTNHLYKAHIYLTRGRRPFCTHADIDTRALFTSDSLIPRGIPMFHYICNHTTVRKSRVIFILIYRSLA